MLPSAVFLFFFFCVEVGMTGDHPESGCGASSWKCYQSINHSMRVYQRPSNPFSLDFACTTDAFRPYHLHRITDSRRRGHPVGPSLPLKGKGLRRLHHCDMPKEEWGTQLLQDVLHAATQDKCWERMLFHSLSWMAASVCRLISLIRSHEKGAMSSKILRWAGGGFRREGSKWNSVHVWTAASPSGRGSSLLCKAYRFD
ncbi:hypothetical protein QBC40DRAFT_280565, partial [Triangularia verruculosa]